MGLRIDRQLGVVVKHFFKMGDVPTVVRGIAVEPPPNASQIPPAAMAARVRTAMSRAGEPRGSARASARAGIEGEIAD